MVVSWQLCFFGIYIMNPCLISNTFLTLTAYSTPVALWTHFLQTEYDPMPISYLK